MAHITVIKSDKTIYEDGVAVLGCDMAGLADDFHALQWNGSEGHIEYTNPAKPNLIVSSKAKMESELGVSYETLLSRRTTREAEMEADSIAE